MERTPSFIENLADRLLGEYSGQLDQLTIVFPNRRAGLFFTKALSDRIERPVWSPEIISFEDFVYALKGTAPADNLSLLMDLYEVFRKITGFEEPFDTFYFWGDMLLKDFNEIDKHLIRAENLFTTLKNLKEIDVEFAFMSDEEVDALRQFWGSTLHEKTTHKESFIRFWSNLYPVYTTFRKVLSQAGRAYSGMIYRDLIEDITRGSIQWEKGKVIFAGFNALIPAEERIITWFLESSKGDIHWDLDAYYFDHPGHEAGQFLRQYYQDKIFRNTFPDRIPAYFENNDKNIQSIASSQYSGQPKIAADVIHTLLREQGKQCLEETVIVFPDESLLSQVLYALPREVDKVNITMGYPLRNSSLFSLFNQLLELQEHMRLGKEKVWFNHRQVLNILNHNLISGIEKETVNTLIQRIEKRNLIYVPAELLNRNELMAVVFDPDPEKEIFEYLQSVLILIRSSSKDFDEPLFYFEKEFSIVLYKLLERQKEIFSNSEITITPALLRRILKYYAQLEKIPFSGEPLQGLQMMGLMETRNLDFKNVIVMCTNEGQLPKTGSQSSFIPHNVRKAFKLPNPDTQDAIYSYPFYRMIQRSDNIYLIYNTEDSYTLQSEPSRYIYQLKFESGYTVHEKGLAMDISVNDQPPIVIKKDDFIMEKLARYYQDPEFRLSPSALNMYLSCPLSFYYRYILDLSEEDEVSEELDAAKFGNILHRTMEDLYQPFLGKPLDGGAFKLMRKNLGQSIRRSFADYYGKEYSNDFQIEGKNLLGMEIIRNYVLKILEKDEAGIPFTVLGLEQKYTHDLQVNIPMGQVRVGLKGIIDRIDQKGDSIRIIDYKTGKDESSFKDLAGLFDASDDKRNKAIFQTFFYAMLFVRNNPDYAGRPVMSGLYNVKELYDKEFDLRIKLKGKGGNNYVDDIIPYLSEYENELIRLISEIYDPSIPFQHAADTDKCFYCKNLGMPSDIEK